MMKTPTVLPVDDEDRMRILTAVASRGPRFQILRVVVITLSLAILAAVPLLGIVRLDLWDGRHVLFGERVPFLIGLRGVVIGIAALWGTTFLTNVIVGRFFCGWGCPVGYVSRLGEDVSRTRRRGGKGWAKWLFQHASGAGFVGTFVAAIMLWWVDPAVLWEGSLQAKAAVVAVWLVLCFGGFLHAFVWRFGFCKTACPIGLYYKLVTSSTPIGITFDETPSPCIECGACEKICPVDLDPKKLGTVPDALDATEVNTMHGEAVPEPPSAELYGDAECLRCGDCIEACHMIFKSREGETPPLRFGRPDKVRKAKDAEQEREAAATS